VHAQEHRIALDFGAIASVFREALETGDGGDIAGFLELLKADLLRTLGELEPHKANAAMAPSIATIEAFQITDVKDGIQYLLQHRPSALAAANKACIELA